MTLRLRPPRLGPTGRVTAAAIMAEHRGAGPGFDVVRLALSGAVFLVHCFVVTLGPAHDDAMWFWAPARPILLSLLPMFFALSGFLIAGSALRTRSAPQFLWFRVLRIAPALTVEVLLSALILGPLLTSANVGDYFASPLFYKYFLNIVGEVQLHLPGMFQGNPTPGVVNQNLWTLRPEFDCYAIVLVLMVSGLVLNRFAFTVFFALTTAAYMVFLATHGWGYRDHGPLQFNVLVYCFLLGIAAYHWRDRIVISHTNMLVAVGVLVLGIHCKPALIPVLAAMTYIMIYFGMQSYLQFKALAGRDYSYGIYLFGFPIQQTLVQLLPAACHVWWIILSIGLPLTIGISAWSWHYVEKPTLRLKKAFARTRLRPATLPMSSTPVLEGAQS